LDILREKRPEEKFQASAESSNNLLFLFNSAAGKTEVIIVNEAGRINVQQLLMLQ